MKTVLIIAPQFAPSSYPPAQRIRLFTNHLEEFGWRAIVLSVEPRYLEETPDWEFVKLLNPNLEVIRSKALPYQWTRKIGIGDLGIRSLYHQRKMAARICRERRIDLLFISGPPWHTFLIGQAIKKRFNIPYVLDYIDPWVSAAGENAKPWRKAHWFRKMAVWLEPKAASMASRIVTVSDGTNESIQKRYPFLTKDHFATIPYGGEKSDIDFVKKNPMDPGIFHKGEGQFNIVYMGTMLPRAYDTLRALFNSVLLIRQERPDLYKSMRFYFIGTTYETEPKKLLVMPTAEEIGVQEVVKEYPKRIPYLETNTLLIRSDAILALGSSEPHYTASKIYPCIYAERPLLAIYHEESSVSQVMKEAEAGEIITFSENQPVMLKTEAIKKAIIQIMDPGYKKPPVRWDIFEKYSDGSMTQRLIQVFNFVA